MLRKPLFLEMFTLLLIVGVVNYFATVNNLYWSVNELDSVVHFLVAAFFLWLYFFSGFFNPRDRGLARFFFVAMIGSLAIAVAWEAYELLLGEAVIQKAAYPYDTTLDFIMDFLGMVAVTFYGYLREINFKKITIQQNEG